MTTETLQSWLESLDLDLQNSPAFAQIYPGLSAAFDRTTMCALLPGLLFDLPGGCTILEFEAGKANFSPEEHCRLQYALNVRRAASGQTWNATVNARVFPTLDEARTFYKQVLYPLAAQVAGRPDFHAYSFPAALVEPLNMTLSVHPLDGLLPTLIGAADTTLLAQTLCPALPEVQDGTFRVREVALDLAHYGRHKRCVLRYRLACEDTATGEPRKLTVYGKVDATGQIEETAKIAAAIRAGMEQPGLPRPFRVPRTFGYLPDLQMLVMEELPGKPVVKQLVKQWSKGKASAEEVRAAVHMCAEILATFHSLPVSDVPLRSFEREIAALHEEIEVVVRVQPELGTHLLDWLRQIEAAGQKSPALQPVFSHGDYTYAQAILDGDDAGLVDFDTACLAEPALDIGQFLSYLRLAIERSDHTQPRIEETESMLPSFLSSYITAAGRSAGQDALFQRVRLYECTSLMHLVLHSWQKFKGSRLKLAIELLAERLNQL